MKFKKYNSIISINKSVYTGQTLPGGVWFVTEKIHGSNLSFIVTKDDIKVCSRNQVLDEDSQYYKIVKNFSDDIFQKLRRLFEGMHYILPTKDGAGDHQLEQVTVYGELAGGYYNNKSNGTRIQKGVQYSPFNFFIGFDICLFYSGDTNTTSCYLSKSDVFRILNIVGIPHVPILYCGEREAAMNFNPNCQTVVPNMFKLDPIDDNIMEGAVISPNRTAYFPDGERIIFKKVNDKFHENKSSKNKPVKISEEVSEEFKIAANEIISLINENRLSNILSHYSDLTEKDFGTILKEMNKDVQQDWSLSTDRHIIISLTKEERKALSKLINTYCARLIRELWLPTVTA